MKKLFVAALVVAVGTTLGFAQEPKKEEPKKEETKKKKGTKKKKETEPTKPPASN